jgi:hypothetical protein
MRNRKASLKAFLRFLIFSPSTSVFICEGMSFVSGAS